MVLGWSVVWMLVGASTSSEGAEATPEAVEFFEKRVRPVLVEHCSKCHSNKDVKGGLRLDSRAALLKGGDTGPAIIPGDARRSLLIEAVRYEPDGYQMPPTGKLPDDAIAALTDWVQQGAVWPGSDGDAAVSSEKFDLAERAKHWSFQPVAETAPPEVQRADWGQSPVDAYVLAKLEAAGLAPAQSAERRVLLRRVSLDLIGLPPTADELEAFLADDSPHAWAKVVERLLASPRYGERWGRHWLDLVRFAETSGHEFDYEIPFAWPYRDYVIRAFNDDVPYDQFLREHLAGDLLREPRTNPSQGTNESVIGTAFYWFSQGKHSPVDIRAEECDLVDNQLDVIGKTFQGLTIACARCHDHKFDPILQQDYYALAGFLQSSRQTLVDLNPPETTEHIVQGLEEAASRDVPLLLTHAVAATEQFVKELPQRLTVKSDDAEAWRKGVLETAHRDRAHPLHMWAHWAGADNLPQRIADWKLLRQREAETRSSGDRSPAGLHSPDTITDAEGKALSPWFFEGAAFERSSTPWLSGNTPDTPLRGVMRPGIWAHSGAVSPRLRGTLRSPTFTITQPYIDYWMHRRGGDGHPPRQNKAGQVSLIVDGFQFIRNPLYGHLTLNVEQAESPRWYRQDVQRFIGSRAYIEIEDLDDGEIVVDHIEFNTASPTESTYNSFLVKYFDDAQIQSTEDLARVYQQAFAAVVERMRQEATYGVPTVRGPDRRAIADLVNWLLQQAPLRTSDPQITKLLEHRRTLEGALPRPQLSIGIVDGTAEDEHLLIRGNPRKPGDPVPRQFLTALQPYTRAGLMGPANGDPGSGRLEWAECIADARNPLTARVLVNRLWMHHFGRGLVPTPDDFGKMGQPPSHPELLDWLASEFVRSGWSIKHMHRVMLLSATYQQSSRIASLNAEERDPQNLLLHRMPVQRLEAEPIRDALLALAGRLDDAMYGPSVPPHLTPFMEGRGRPAQSGPLDGNGRRSLYINVRRNFLSPMFLAFDFPTPFTTMGKRSTSNVPAQALTLMNNPLVVQQSGLWAESILRRCPDPSARIATLYRDAFSREPTSEELAAALEFLGPAANSSDPGPWRDLAHVLVNVKEFVFVE
ncbi:MAG: PSD1 and planctomycete cytochrome C domain-containing protein [Planctomycetaceae bacterium]|nr:PSD1 and planctomycete cytochrome C domain-containing protein [Planctomycetaceae bacterium]